jgi:hypothetical protein
MKSNFTFISKEQAPEFTGAGTKRSIYDSLLDGLTHENVGSVECGEGKLPSYVRMGIRERAKKRGIRVELCSAGKTIYVRLKK